MWDTAKWRTRIKKRLSLFAIGALFLGLGMNIALAFSPNIVSPFVAGILVFIAIVITITGIVLLSVGLFRKLPEELLVTPEAYQRVSLVCHIWEGAFMLYPEHKSRLIEARGEKYLDIWEWMKAQKHPYSEDTWKKYLPLFADSIKMVNDTLMETIKLFPDSIDEKVKMDVINTIDQLKNDSVIYLISPQLFPNPTETRPDGKSLLDVRFMETINHLAELSRRADKIYKEKK